MAITISAEQRDALYERIIDYLAAFDDLPRALEQGDLESAYRLGRRFSDGLRLIQEELGWGDESSRPFSLGTIPDHELRAILQRIGDDAIQQAERERPERQELQGEWRQVALVRDTCEKAVAELAGD